MLTAGRRRARCRLPTRSQTRPRHPRQCRRPPCRVRSTACPQPPAQYPAGKNQVNPNSGSVRHRLGTPEACAGQQMCCRPADARAGQQPGSAYAVYQLVVSCYLYDVTVAAAHPYSAYMLIVLLCRPLTHMVHVVSMLLVPSRFGSTSFQSNDVSGAQYSRCLSCRTVTTSMRQQQQHERQQWHQ